MWPSTSNSEPNNSPLRSGRLPDTTAESHSISNGWKHSGETITHILATITRQRGKIPQDTNGTSESAAPTSVNKLRHPNYKQAPSPAMDCTTRSISSQPICCAQ